MKNHHPETPPSETSCCPEIPELRRLKYFYGQMLGSQDFKDEQSYFREKLKLLNRCLHGYGVVCGLEVTPEPIDEPCDPEVDRRRRELEQQLEELERRCKELAEQLAQAEDSDDHDPEALEALKKKLAECEGQKEKIRQELDELCPPYDPEQDRPTEVVVDCGVALDCDGNEIILRRPHKVDLWQYLSPAERRIFEEGQTTALFLSICFCELPVEPVRPVQSDSCTPPTGCRHAKIQDSYRIRVTVDPPGPDERCDPCCCACEDPCVLLARIDNFHPGRPLDPHDIHNEVRRLVALHEWATVSGISWVHGGSYRDDEAAQVLGRAGLNSGLEFRFSRPVLTETLREGIAEIWVIEGGKGRSAGIYNVAARIVDLPPGEETTDRLRFQQTSDDKFHQGDRVLIRLRTDFILDECCRPVDGNHVGGRVPLLEEHAGDHQPDHGIEACRKAPGLYGPWRSGSGVGGGTFESWFFIHE